MHFSYGEVQELEKTSQKIPLYFPNPLNPMSAKFPFKIAEQKYVTVAHSTEFIWILIFVNLCTDNSLQQIISI